MFMPEGLNPLYISEQFLCHFAIFQNKKNEIKLTYYFYYFLIKQYIILLLKL